MRIHPPIEIFASILLTKEHYHQKSNLDTCILKLSETPFREIVFFLYFFFSESNIQPNVVENNIYGLSLLLLYINHCWWLWVISLLLYIYMCSATIAPIQWLPIYDTIIREIVQTKTNCITWHITCHIVPYSFNAWGFIL